MPNNKRLNWAEDLSKDVEPSEEETEDSVATPAPAANDADGWEQYRQWVSKAPAPRGRRVGIDPALYTWKGYRNWTEQVRRNWTPDSGDDDE